MSRRFDRQRQFAANDVLPFITGTNDQPVELVGLDVRVHVTGLFAETTQILRLRNPNSRDLEANLCFPLPDGASVCGYGIDVDGQLVDGVVIPKQEARRILEAEIRKGVDPGLVEQAQGNVYRTRIYPLPAGGVRTVKLVYVTPLTVEGSDAAYHLPLGHASDVDRLSLRVEVSQAPVEPVATGGLGNLSLTNIDNRWVAQAELTSGAGADDLLVTLPTVPDYFVAVERFDGDDFFCASCRLVGDTDERWTPERVALLWDASGSRQSVDRELDLIEALAGVWRSVTFDVVLLRDIIEPDAATFTVEDGDATALLAFLRDAPHDGGTNLAAVALDEPPHPDDEAWLVFSDGLDTVGNGLPYGTSPRVFAITEQAQNDQALLKLLADRSGGMFVNLRTTSTESAARRILSSSESLRLQRTSGCDDVHVSTSSGRLTVVGRLTEDIANVLFEGPGAPSDQLSVVRSGSTEGRNLARAWAGQQAQVETLLGTLPDRIAELGRRYGLVTPGTSLLVLETLEQHLEYDIEPASTRPTLRDAFLRQRRDQQAARESERDTHVDHVVDLWRKRVAWWERDYSAGRDRAKKGKVESSHSSVPAGAPAPRMSQAPDMNVMRMQSSQADGGSFHGAEQEESMMFDEVPASGPAGAPVAEGAPFGGRGDVSAKEEASAGATASVRIQPWSPDTPYLAAMREAGPDEAYATYLSERDDYAASPAFYLDCADHLFNQGLPTLGLRVLSNLLELALDDAALLRMYAWRMQQAGEIDAAVQTFEHVLEMRDDEPQSHRDLALALEARWQRDANPEDAIRAMKLLYAVITSRWDRFPEIELIALMELNRLIHIAEHAGIERPEEIDDRLVKLLDLDVRISMSWDADLTDVDLHVFEPTGEHAYYGHNQTEIGGLVSRDFTQGYGPEEYVLRRAVPGNYTVKTHYYGSHQQTIAGACTVIVNVFTNYGRDDEEHQVLTLRLEQASDQVLVGKITIDGDGTAGVAGDLPDWIADFRSLEVGMSVDEITGVVGQPDEMRGTDTTILVYRPAANAELHVTLDPRLVSVEHVANGAKIELLSGASGDADGLLARLRSWWDG